ncbi:MAG: type IV pilus secretin PilQ [Methylococcaceae bacterium]
MKTKQGSIVLNQVGHFLGFCPLLFLLLCQSARVDAGDLAITAIDFAALSGDKLQIQLDMNGAAVQPKVFQTDNPARIALDFVGVTNALAKKMIPVNQGAVSTIYIAEAADRIRVVINLLEATPFETKVAGNKVLLTLNRAKTIASANLNSIVAKPKIPTTKKNVNSVVATLLPEQVISGFDFKRGDKGEGRILIYLANPDTVVNSKQEGGKVVINLLNTRLPENLAKRLDVTEFATPIKFIDTVASKQETTVTVTTQNELYDYSLFQSEGLLTIEFRPLSNEEKDALDRVRVKYKGDRLSLNFQEIDIRSVIAILAEFTGQNVVAGDDVNGTITLKLDDVPWDEALDFIMMTKGLEKFESGTVTLVAPVGKIKEYKEKQQETATVIEQLDPLVTEYIKINYARAENFRNLLNGRDAGAIGACGINSPVASSSSSSALVGGGVGGGPMNTNVIVPGQSQGTQATNLATKNDKIAMLSARGSAVVDTRTNTLIVRETPKQLEEMKKLIRKLDVPVRQVMIESRIVNASKTFAKTLGVRFGVAGTSTTFNSIAASSSTINNPINGTAIIDNALVDLAANNPYGTLGMTLAKGADYVLNLEITALQDQGLVELVANPRVMTADRCQATIKQGQQIPYQTSSGNTGPVTQLIDAVLQLDVLPQITPNGSVIMALKITNDSVPKGTVVNSAPPIDTQSIQTNVHVQDGETIVLGGVFNGDQTKQTNAVPFLADLPGIGFLFKKTNEVNDKKELLIFITPKIVQANTASN